MKTAGSGSALPQYLPNPKSKFPYLWKVYLSYFLSTVKKAQAILLKVFKITDFKSLQQENTKGTPRP